MVENLLVGFKAETFVSERIATRQLLEEQNNLEF